jgi:hypothetical protein
MKQTVAALACVVHAVLLPATMAVTAQERRSDGTPAVAARPWPPARLPDGQPDIQGNWAAVNPGSVSLTNPISVAVDFDQRITGADVRLPSRIIDPPDGQLPYQPWAAARQKQQAADYDFPTKPEHIDPQHRCLLSGVPRLYTIAPPFKVVQPPGSIVFIWDEYHAYRVIPLDGRPHVGPGLKLWMGDARGRWEGNTLIIDTTNIRGARLTYTGDFFTDNAHIVERLTIVDVNTMRYEATVDDPAVFTRPWTMRVSQRRRPDDEMWETACYEGNVPPDTWLLTPDRERK